jgi:hypothetical protein
LGDYDNDGKLDILLSGYSNTGAVSQVWHNQGGGVFTNLNAGLPGVYNSSVLWGDFDNDGKLDLLLSGQVNPYPITQISQIWRNLGNGTFANAGAGLPGVIYSSAAFGDFDNDGKLDLLLTGYAGTAPIGQIWHNLTPSPNNPPSAPGGLAASPVGHGVTLTWNPGGDAQTPSTGLSYNLRVGTTPGASDILSPEADISTGFRRVAQLGNADERFSATLTNLTLGKTYYWSVQAVDTSFAGSPFAPEASFTAGQLLINRMIYNVVHNFVPPGIGIPAYVQEEVVFDEGGLTNVDLSQYSSFALRLFTPAGQSLKVTYPGAYSSGFSVFFEAGSDTTSHTESANLSFENFSGTLPVRSYTLCGISDHGNVLGFEFYEDYSAPIEFTAVEYSFTASYNPLNTPKAFGFTSSTSVPVIFAYSTSQTNDPGPFATLSAFAQPACVISATGGVPKLQWQSRLNVRYQPQTSPDLGLGEAGWTNLGPPIIGNGLIMQVTDTSAGYSTRFYRLRIQP